MEWVDRVCGDCVYMIEVSSQVNVGQRDCTCRVGPPQLVTIGDFDKRSGHIVTQVRTLYPVVNPQLAACSLHEQRVEQDAEAEEQ